MKLSIYACIMLAIVSFSCKKNYLSAKTENADAQTDFESVVASFSNINILPPGKFLDSVSKNLIPVIITNKADLLKMMTEFSRIEMKVVPNSSNAKKTISRSNQTFEGEKTMIGALGIYQYSRMNFTEDGKGWIVYTANINWGPSPLYGNRVKIISSISSVGSGGGSANSAGTPLGGWTVSYSYNQTSGTSQIESQGQRANLAWTGTLTQYKTFSFLGFSRTTSSTVHMPFNDSVFSSEFDDPFAL